jgi:hypothetical protein
LHVPLPVDERLLGQLTDNPDDGLTEVLRVTVPENPCQLVAPIVKLPVEPS